MVVSKGRGVFGVVRERLALGCVALVFGVLCSLLPFARAFAVSSNLITNPGAETGNTSGWTVTANGGNGWGIDTGAGHSGTNSFATSYNWDIMYQRIDLLANGYTQNQLDTTQPAITFSQWIATRGDQGGKYYLLFKLLGSDGTTVKASYNIGTQGSPMLLNAGVNWFQQSHTFTNYGSDVRYVYFEVGGRDQSTWAGFYGTHFDDASITLNNVPSAPASLGTSSMVNGSWTSNNQPAFSFTQSDADGGDTVQYRMQIDDSSDFSSPVVDYTSALASQGAASFTVGQAAGSGTYATGSAGQTLTDGSYYWRVSTTDVNGISSAYATANSGSIAFKVDTVRPTAPGAPSATSPTSSQTPAWTWTASTDAASGLATLPYTIQWSQSATFASAVSAATASSASYTHTSPLDEGVWYARVSASDVAGNNSSYSSTSSVIIDRTAPVITVAGANPTTLIVGGSFTDAGATATDTVDGSVAVTTSGSVNMTAPGTYTLTYSAQDSAGNASTATRTVTVVAVPATAAKPTQTPTTTFATTEPEATTTATPPAQIVLNDYAQFFSDEGKPLNLPADDKVYFKIDESGHMADHSLTVQSVSADTVTFIVASTPFAVTMKVGETRNVDVDRNGIDDINIRLIGVADGRAQFTVRQLAAASVVKDSTATTSLQVATPDNSLSVWWLLALAGLAVAAMAWIVVRRRRSV